jgi:hypothetical protein
MKAYPLFMMDYYSTIVISVYNFIFQFTTLLPSSRLYYLVHDFIFEFTTLFYAFILVYVRTNLFHRDTFGQVPGLVYIGAFQHRDVVGHQLKRYRQQQRVEVLIQ